MDYRHVVYIYKNLFIHYITLGLSGCGRGNSRMYNKALQAIIERMDILMCLSRCKNNAISAVNQLVLWFIYIEFDWFCVELVFTTLLFELFWYLTIITRLQSSYHIPS